MTLTPPGTMRPLLAAIATVLIAWNASAQTPPAPEPSLPTVSLNRADPIQLTGNTEPVDITPWPTGGNWIESIVPDNSGKWYAFYHNETNEASCGDVPKTAPRVGVARSEDQGATWTDLGIILEAARDTFACDTSNDVFVGGVGDVTAMLDREERDVYIYFSQYGARFFMAGRSDFVIEFAPPLNDNLQR